MMGDNGASAEGTMQGTTNEVGTAANEVKESIPFLLSMIDELGGPRTYNHYPVGWAHAMDAPMQWTKQIASHFGGSRNGMVISWPARIKDKGGLRSQFCHVIDIVPTIYEAAGITPPDELDGVKQKPIEGVGLVYTFGNATAATQHGTQYFEMMGNRAIYKDGWMASTTPLRLPWVTMGFEPNPDDFKWELYNVNEDFSQSKNVAASPDKLKELQETFDIEAKKYNVCPLNSSFASRADPAIRRSLTRGRSEFVYFPGMIRIPEGSAPDFKNKSWTVAAEVTIPQGGANGVLATIGGRYGGWALLVHDNKPVFAYAFSNQPEHKYRVVSSEPLTAGNHVIRVKFKSEAAVSARQQRRRCWWTKSRSRKARSRKRSASASLSMKPSTWAKTPGRRCWRSMRQRCPIPSQVRSLNSPSFSSRNNSAPTNSADYTRNWRKRWNRFSDGLAAGFQEPCRGHYVPQTRL